jgi:hypothetical protein
VADLNRDGNVNILDLSTLEGNFGLSGSGKDIFKGCFRFTPGSGLAEVD